MSDRHYSGQPIDRSEIHLGSSDTASVVYSLTSWSTGLKVEGIAACKRTSRCRYKWTPQLEWPLRTSNMHRLSLLCCYMRRGGDGRTSPLPLSPRISVLLSPHYSHTQNLKRWKPHGNACFVGYNSQGLFHRSCDFCFGTFLSGIVYRWHFSWRTLFNLICFCFHLLVIDPRSCIMQNSVTLYFLGRNS